MKSIRHVRKIDCWPLDSIVPARLALKYVIYVLMNKWLSQALLYDGWVSQGISIQ